MGFVYTILWILKAWNHLYFEKFATKHTKNWDAPENFYHCFIRHEISQRICGFPRILKFRGGGGGGSEPEIPTDPTVVPTVGGGPAHPPPARSIRSLAIFLFFQIFPVSSLFYVHSSL